MVLSMERVTGIFVLSMEIMMGHILFYDWRYYQFRSGVTGDNDRTILMFSQRKPSYLLRSAYLSVRM